MTNRTSHQTPNRDAERIPTLRQGPVIGPLGKQMSLEDLPEPTTKRWVIRRKAEVVAGVRGGLLTLDEACKRYNLTVDEFRSWQRLLESHGVKGLRTTKIKKYRKNNARPDEIKRKS